MEREEEEIEKLLGEIPRATSAPPHLEELQRALVTQMDSLAFGKRHGGGQGDGDDGAGAGAPFDPVFEDLYDPYTAARKLNNDAAGASSLSPFYSGLALDSPRTSLIKQRQLEMLKKYQQEQSQRQSLQQQRQQRQQPTFDSQNPLDRRVAEQTHHRLATDGSSIPSTLANLSLESDPDSKRGLQSLSENGNGYMKHGNIGAGGPDGPEFSNGFLSPTSSLESTAAGFRLGSLASMDSAMMSAPRKPSPSLERLDGDSYRVPNESIPAAMMQKGQKQTRLGLARLDWNPAMVHPTPADGFSTAYLQMRQLQYQHLQLLQQQQSAMFPVTSARQPGRRALHGSNASSNGLHANSVSLQHLQLDHQMLALVQQQKQELARQMAEERQRQQLQQRFLQDQQLLEQQSSMYASLQSQAGGALVGPHYPNYLTSLAFSATPQQSSAQQHQVGAMAALLDAGWSQQIPSALVGVGGNGSYCRYYAQGHCIRGDACPYLHSYSHGFGDRGISQLSSASLKEALAAAAVSAEEDRFSASFSNKLASLRSSQGIQNQGSVVISGGRRKEIAGNGLALNGNASLPLEKVDSEKFLGLEEDGLHPNTMQQQAKFSTLEELEGRIYEVAKDQHGCRFLQRKFDEGSTEDVSKIFEEIRGHIVELMTDPFGNYLVQKLLEVCNEAQLMEILDAVTHKHELVTISLNMHGTRAVQKLIETLRTPEQVKMVISSLNQGVVTLIKDLNGNHVVQRCLQRLSNEDNQFIFDAAASHCVEIASHRHGCCVLQRCVDFASGVQQQFLVSEIAANALVLSQDPFGNYVVQYILELGHLWASAEVLARLEGSYPHLAMQKFSSNVVEKCLKLATEDTKAHVVRELIASSLFGQLLQDPYANYVIQCALQVTKGVLHVNLVDAIRPHVPALRSSPYGKRILSRTHLKK